MQITLQHKKALVGASTQGIGLAIAQELAASGASVTLMARNKENLQKQSETLPIVFSDQKHNYLVADFSDFDSFQSIILDYVQSNKVDILVNNTQGPPPGGAIGKQSEDYQSAFNQLFQTVVLTTNLVLPYMKKNKFGRIINVTSSTVKEPSQNLVLSNAMRSALVSWAKTLSVQVAPFGITVNNVLTGLFETQRLISLMQREAETKGISFEELKKQKMTTVPVGRLGKPEEYGYLATFLASDKAAYITGTSIQIDGGVMKSLL